jgi:3-methyladenine DNA glycosylase AlkC
MANLKSNNENIKIKDLHDNLKQIMAWSKEVNAKISELEESYLQVSTPFHYSITNEIELLYMSFSRKHHLEIL